MTWLTGLTRLLPHQQAHQCVNPIKLNQDRAPPSPYNTMHASSQNTLCGHSGTVL